MILSKHLINAILVLLQIDIFKVKNYVNAWNKKSSTFPVNQEKEAKWGDTNTKIERS